MTSFNGKISHISRYPKHRHFHKFCQWSAPRSIDCILHKGVFMVICIFLIHLFKGCDQIMLHWLLLSLVYFYSCKIIILLWYSQNLLIMDWVDKSSITGDMISIVMGSNFFTLEIHAVTNSWNTMRCGTIDLGATSQMNWIRFSSAIFNLEYIFTNSCNSASVGGVLWKTGSSTAEVSI